MLTASPPAGSTASRRCLLIVTKQPNANVIETVDQHQGDCCRNLQEWIPSGIKIAVLVRPHPDDPLQHCTTFSARWSISVCLVMAVVFVFLRRATPVIAAGITVPLSLVGSCAAMWAAGFSIDNLSLMALTISVGFVVDDAIVMIENIESNVERGMGRMEAALLGAKQIGFTVVSISLSLIAVFIPLAVHGRRHGTTAARIFLYADLRHYRFQRSSR